MLLPFDELPEEFQNDAVKKYYDILKTKKRSIIIKRTFDIVMSVILLVILLIPIIILALAVKLTSRGPIFYKQVRVTTYNRQFRILKFRTMVENADKIGTLVTTLGDPRITKIGGVLRKYRLDELPQIFNVLKGDMSFVGTRPEVPKYVEKYTPAMFATLLMPAGITSLASIKFKNEDRMLETSTNIDDDYISIILPKKMHYNLLYIKSFGFRNDIYLMVKTIKEVLFH
ncbi:MAG: sugar transferase [Ruminococcus sp.]|nr:sugar transferase [Ruminococcus sp.]